METNRLKQFHTIYQTGSLRQAAELLAISHSGLSKSMAALAEELGHDIFIQSGRGIVFTDYGHNLALKVPGILEHLENALEPSKFQQRAILKIGSFEVFTTYFVKVMAPFFVESDLDFHELIPGKMETALLNREIDMAITYEPIPIPGIEHLKVSTIEMGAYVKKGAFKGQSIQDIPFAAPLIPVEGAPTGMKGLDSWPDDLFSRKIKFRVDLMETAISLARDGQCAVFIPSFVAKLHNEVTRDEYHLVKKALPAKMKKIKRDVYIVKRKSTIEDGNIKKLAKFLRSLV